MDAREVERSRAALGLAVLVGAFATLLAGGLLAPHIAFPLSFGVAAVVGALPTFALMRRRLGPARAAALAALVAIALAGASMLLAFGACVATGCVG